MMEFLNKLLNRIDRYLDLMDERNGILMRQLDAINRVGAALEEKG